MYNWKPHVVQQECNHNIFEANDLKLKNISKLWSYEISAFVSNLVLHRQTYNYTLNFNFIHEILQLNTRKENRSIER